MKQKQLQKLSAEVQKFGALFAEPKLDLRSPAWWTDVDRQGQEFKRLSGITGGT
jgi:hypothetical protein